MSLQRLQGRKLFTLVGINERKWLNDANRRRKRYRDSTNAVADRKSLGSKRESDVVTRRDPREQSGSWSRKWEFIQVLSLLSRNHGKIFEEMIFKDSPMRFDALWLTIIYESFGGLSLRRQKFVCKIFSNADTCREIKYARKNI